MASDEEILADRVDTIRQTVTADKGAGSPVRIIVLAVGALVAAAFGVYSLTGDSEESNRTVRASLIPEEARTTERARPTGGIFGDIRPRVGRNTESEIDQIKAELARLKEIINNANDGEAVAGNVLLQVNSLKKTLQKQSAQIDDLTARLEAAEARAKLIPATVATGPDDSDRLGGDILLFDEGKEREDEEKLKRIEEEYGRLFPDRGEVTFTPAPGQPPAE